MFQNRVTSYVKSDNIIMKSKKKQKMVGRPGDHFPDMLSSISRMQGREGMCDLVFLCRGGRVTAHRAFLTGLSPLLTKMFDISRQFQVD